MHERHTEKSMADAQRERRVVPDLMRARERAHVRDDELAPGTVETTAVDSDTGPAPAARGERSGHVRFTRAEAQASDGRRKLCGSPL